MTGAGGLDQDLLELVDVLVVNRVEENSPAARAKLQQGDVITTFAGKAIKSPRDLAVAVGDTKAGTTQRMTLWREGREQTVNVTIGVPAKEKAAQAGEPATDRNPVGLALAPLSAEQREELGQQPQAKGVVVSRVAPGSLASESGIRSGDVIVRVGDDAVTTPADAVAKIRKAESEKREAVPLLVMREGTTYYLALQLQQS